MTRPLLIAAFAATLALPAVADEDILRRPYIEFCWGGAGDRITAFKGWTDLAWLRGGRSGQAAIVYDEATGETRALPRSPELAERLAERSCIQKRVAQERAE